ncbi:uncharacterized protein EKO05_0010194 [Ascochyta rabiei]|uniref:uncharacterized protein n=1 Tax=Didymella rabiei TaxID=5454 RepID=UPI0021FCB943|nr:uncharacterized protein EKO05_0010194 [Ascochyta rabiei]UPX19945.1 hypothetical protein EKO05_0010194 [Ascochyta rabiei]
MCSYPAHRNKTSRCSWFHEQWLEQRSSTGSVSRYRKQCLKAYMDPGMTELVATTCFCAARYEQFAIQLQKKKQESNSLCVLDRDISTFVNDMETFWHASNQETPLTASKPHTAFPHRLAMRTRRRRCSPLRTSLAAASYQKQSVSKLPRTPRIARYIPLHRVHGLRVFGLVAWSRISESLFSCPVRVNSYVMRRVAWRLTVRVCRLLKLRWHDHVYRCKYISVVFQD